MKTLVENLQQWCDDFEEAGRYNTGDNYRQVQARLGAWCHAHFGSFASTLGIAGRVVERSDALANILRHIVHNPEIPTDPEYHKQIKSALADYDAI